MVKKNKKQYLCRLIAFLIDKIHILIFYIIFFLLLRFYFLNVKINIISILYLYLLNQV